MKNVIYVVLYGEGTKFKDRYKAAKFLRDKLQVKSRLNSWCEGLRDEENCVYFYESDRGWYSHIKRSNFQRLVTTNYSRLDIVVLSDNKNFIGIL